ncbi:hypothetical protein D9M73_136750 [compost metagenome]
MQLCQKLAQARDRDFAQQNDERGNLMDALDHRRVRIARAHQQQNHRRHHDLVGNRIEKHAELRDRSVGTREIAVKIIGDAHQAIKRESGGIALRPAWPPQEPGEQRHRDNPRQGEQVGQGQHSPALLARSRARNPNMTST